MSELQTTISFVSILFMFPDNVFQPSFEVLIKLKTMAYHI